MALERETRTVYVYVIRCDECGARMPDAHTSAIAREAALFFDWQCKGEWEDNVYTEIWICKTCKEGDYDRTNTTTGSETS